jgi:hypothetical protein
MNLNQLAKEITKIEGGRVNLSIAQVKEVLRCFGDVAYKIGDDMAFLEICSKLYLGAKKRADLVAASKKRKAKDSSK